MDKHADAFRTIREVAEDLDLPQHVLRFWETRFTHVQPLKRGGGRRYYRPADIDLLRAIRHLLYGEGYTIKGVQRLLREQGPKVVASLASGLPDRSLAPLPSFDPALRLGEPDEGDETIEIDDDHADAVATLSSRPGNLPNAAKLAFHAILADLLDCKAILDEARFGGHCNEFVDHD